MRVYITLIGDVYYSLSVMTSRWMEVKIKLLQNKEKDESMQNVDVFILKSNQQLCGLAIIDNRPPPLVAIQGDHKHPFVLHCLGQGSTAIPLQRMKALKY